MYSPSPVTSTLPFQYGAPSQSMSAREAYGPKSSSSTVAGVCPRPLTVSLSKISAPGRITASETIVVTFGAALAIVVSETSPQGVTTAS